MLLSTRSLPAAISLVERSHSFALLISLCISAGERYRVLLFFAVTFACHEDQSRRRHRASLSSSDDYSVDRAISPRKSASCPPSGGVIDLTKDDSSTPPVRVCGRAGNTGAWQCWLFAWLGACQASSLILRVEDQLRNRPLRKN